MTVGKHRQLGGMWKAGTQDHKSSANVLIDFYTSSVRHHCFGLG